MRHPSDVLAGDGRVRVLSGRCFTLATEADAAAGTWQHFDAATWAMRNLEG